MSLACDRDLGFLVPFAWRLQRGTLPQQSSFCPIYRPSQTKSGIVCCSLPGKLRTRRKVVCCATEKNGWDNNAQQYGPFQVGDVIADRYRVLDVLGRGAQGTTYDAIDMLDNSNAVAVKTLGLRGMRTWKALELFEREGRALQSLSHPSIPKYIHRFEVDVDGDRVFVLVQQKAEGASLQELLDSGFRFTDRQVMSVFVKLLDVLRYLGTLNPPMLHRDVKPGNVIINISTTSSNDVDLSLVDFGAVNSGVANDTRNSTGLNPKSAQTASTFASMMVGTYGFMAPEQFGGAADVRSDLYSAGATVLFAITGRPPSEIPQRRLQLDIESVIPAQRRLELGNVYAVMQKLLEPAPEDRYQSAQQALSALSAKQSPRDERAQLYREYYDRNRERAQARSSFDYGSSSLYPTPDRYESDADDRNVGKPRSNQRKNSIFNRIQSFVSKSASSQLARKRLRKPAGSRVALDIDESNRLFRMFIPPQGFTAKTASSGAFALAWNGFVGFWTIGAVTGGAPFLFSLFSIPFWYAGAKMAKGVVDDVRSHTELVISNCGGEREVYFFSLQVKGALGSTRSAEGDSRDLVDARVDATMYVNNQPVTNIVLREGVREHVFGQDLTEPEQEWVCSEINYFLNANPA